MQEWLDSWYPLANGTCYSKKANSFMPDSSQLILHVKGTEDQTTELPRQVVRAAIAQGQLTHSQLIWSTDHNAWKQVRELPHLLPSQKLAPAPTPRPRAATGALPKVAAHQTGTVPRVATGALPKVAAYQTGAVPRVATGALPKVAAAPQHQTDASPHVTVTSPSARPAQTASGHYREVEEDDGIQWGKWACLGLGIVVLAMIGMNYQLVDRPLVSSLSTTPYANVTVHAHLGGFMQPGALVIHIAPSPSLTASNMTHFLAILAHGTPASPLSGNPYERVSLTSGWTSQYTISGHAWKEFGRMGQEEEAQRKEFLLDQMQDAEGRPLITPNPALDDDARQAVRDKVLATFVQNFSRS